MDNHPLKNGYVFQIDGNLGATAAITEFLVQSGADFIRLMPALPSAWKNGKAQGIALPGAAIISLEWQRNELIKAEISAKESWENKIFYKNKVYSISIKAGEVYSISL